MATPVYVYALSDPDEPVHVRYVGVATDVRRRLRSHVHESKAAKSHRQKWIRTLTRRGVLPIVTLLEITDEHSWPEREQFWVRWHRKNGHNLTNGNDGGMGSLNPTPEARLALSANARRAWVTRDKDVMRQMHANLTPEERSRRVRKGHHTRRQNGTQMSAAARQSIGDKARQRLLSLPIEERQRLSALANQKRIENTTHDQRSDAAKCGWEKRRRTTTPKPALLCSAQDCDRTAKCKSLCFKHYQRQHAAELGHWPASKLKS